MGFDGAPDTNAKPHGRGLGSAPLTALQVFALRPWQKRELMGALRAGGRFRLSKPGRPRFMVYQIRLLRPFGRDSDAAATNVPPERLRSDISWTS